MPPVAVDDIVSTLRNTPVSIAVLSNETNPVGVLDPGTLAVVSGPVHGSVVVQRPILTYDDNSSPVGDGMGSALVGVVDDFGHITLVVNGNYDMSGDYALFVRLGVSDFSNFDPGVFNFRFDATLTSGVANTSDIPGLVPGTHYIAWIDNTVGPGYPDTSMEAVGPPETLYTPDPGFIGTDIFTYTVNDTNGLVSNAAIVTITVNNQPPVAVDDFTSARENIATPVDVLANDYDPDGLIDPATLAIASGPAHGVATVEQTPLGQTVVVYTSAPGFRGTDTFTYTVRDNDGLASNEAIVSIDVHNQPPVANPDSATTDEGKPVAIDVLANDSDPDGALVPNTLTVVTGPTRGTVAVQQTSTGQSVLVYTPDRKAAPATLVIDDPSDVADGNYSQGHLTLREAVQLANADRYSETFSYVVKDNDGLTSNPATVTVDVRPGPTTITFDPRLTTWSRATLWPGVWGGLLQQWNPWYNVRVPATLRLSQVGDMSEGNSALAITSPITIRGPSGANRITLAGPGRSTDLRAFVVPAGGQLTLENLTLSGWSSDGNGGAINVPAGGTAALTKCTLASNVAFADGGAIYSYGTVNLTGCTLSSNSAVDRGGGVFNAGTLTLAGSTLSGSRADRGGGLFNNWGGRVSMTGGAFSGNVAVNRGGGFLNYDLGNVMTLSNVTITGNSADEGGGFFNAGCLAVNLALADCIIRSNTARMGGGFVNGAEESAYYPKIGLAPGLSGSATLTRCSLLGNVADRGGGFYVDTGGIVNVGVAVTFSDGSIMSNRAAKGGGFFVERGPVVLTGSTIAGNRATEGGGVFVDLDTATLTGCTISGNTASGTGGGILNNGIVVLATTTLAGNGAGIGGGLYNGFGTANLTATTISGNAATKQGGGLYNDLGAVTMTNSVVAGNRRGTRPDDIAGLTPVDWAGSGGLVNGTHGNLTGSAPSASGSPIDPTAQALLPTPDLPVFRDRAEYRLDASGRLLRRSDGSSWAVIETGVTWYAVAPNGDLWLLNKRQELKVLKAGYDWYTHDIGVLAATMDSRGTVYELDSQHNLEGVYAALDGYYVLPAIDPNSPPLALDTPDDLTILRAMGMSRSTDSFWPPSPTFPFVRELTAMGYEPPPDDTGAPGQGPSDLPVFRDVNIVKERLIDRIDPPRYFPGVGLAQMHHAKWKCTILFTEVSINAPRVEVFYIDMDHLHRYVPGTPITRSAGAGESGGAVTSIIAIGTGTVPTSAVEFGGYRATPAVFDVSMAATTETADRLQVGRTVRSLTTAPDGTIYALGGWYSGHLWIGPDAAPLMLWRMVPGSDWQSLFRVYSYSVAPDNTLYVLDQDHQLRQLVPRSASWSTLAAGIESFAMAPDGTVFALSGDHKLQRLAPHSAQLSILAAGVQSFAMTPDGTVFALNDLSQLRRLENRGTWTVLDTVVQSFIMAADGAVYELNGQRQLKKLVNRTGWTILDTGVQSFAMAIDGTVYALGMDHQFKRLSARDHWTVLDTGVKSFVVAPSAFYDVYVLRDSHVLRRLEAGHDWYTVRTDVASMTIDSYGVVQARDTEGRLWFVWSDFTAPVMPPIRPGFPPPLAEDPPDLAMVLKVVNIAPDPNLTIVDTLLVDQIDPPRDFPVAGPAQMHHAQWAFQIYTVDTNQLIATGYIDKDHVHLYTGGQTISG